MLPALALSAHAADPPPLGIPDDVTVEAYSYCLPSGLRVLFEPRRGRSDLSLVMVVEAGAAGDPPGQEGMAHLVEHLWFRTARSGGETLWTFAEAMGAGINAATEHDQVEYQTLGAKRLTRALLGVEGARLADPLASIDEASFEVEREVVRSELRENVVDTGSVAFEALRSRLYPAPHPYGRSVIGSHATLDAIDLAAVKAWAAERYVPANATLLVHGDLDPARLRQLLDDTLPEPVRVAPATGPVGCGPRRTAGALPEPDRTLLRTTANVPRRLVLFGWSVPGGDENAALAGIAIEYGGRWARDRIGRGLDCGVDAGRLASTVSCAAVLLDGDDPEDIARRAVAGMPDAWTSNYRPAVGKVLSSWYRARKSSLFLGLEDVDARTSSVTSREARAFHVTADPQGLRAALRLGTTLGFDEAVQDFGRAWFTRERMAVALVEPDDSAPDVPLADVHAGRGADPLADPGEVDLARLREILPDPALDGVRRLTLPNGLDVVLVPWGELPIARARLLLPGGPARAEHAVLDLVAWQLASRPTGYVGDGTMYLSQVPTGIGGRWTERLAADRWSLGIDGANPAAQVWLLRQRLDAAADADARRGKWAEVFAEEIAEAEAQAAFRAEVARWEHLAPGLRQWWFDRELLAAAEGLRPRDVEDWIARVLRPDGAALVVVGKLDPAALEAEVRAWLGTWRSALPAPPAPPATDVPLPEGDPVLVFEETGATTSSIDLACRIGGDAEAASLVATSVETGLQETLRHGSGQTYGVHAWVDEEDYGASLHVTTQVPHAAAATTVAALRDAVRSATARLDERGLARLKLATARRQATELQTTTDVLERLAAVLPEGQPADALTGRAERLAAIDVAAVTGVLEPCAGREIVTVLGRPALVEELGALGVSASLAPGVSRGSP